MNARASPSAPPLDAIEPMLPARAGTPFTDAAWAFELPPGGYRVLAEFGSVPSRLHSMRHLDLTRWFPEVAEAFDGLDMARTVLDGHVCVLDVGGRNDAQRLHERALQPGLQPGGSPVVYCVQDLLVAHGCDLRDLPWSERQRLLRELPLGDGGTVRRGHALHGDGEWLARQAVALGHGAVVAKRRDAPYRGGRCPHWLWIPCPSWR